MNVVIMACLAVAGHDFDIFRHWVPVLKNKIRQRASLIQEECEMKHPGGGTGARLSNKLLFPGFEIQYILLVHFPEEVVS